MMFRKPPPEEMSNLKYLSTKQIIDEYPFTLGQLRDYLRRRRRTALEAAVLKIGKRLYFRRDLFEEWLQSSPYLENKWRREGKRWRKSPA